MLAPIIPAGFYYKTFMWPASFWKKLYEPAIRAAAGLGRAPELPDPDRYQHRHAHCDVLVAGGGRAGLEAALAASRIRQARHRGGRERAMGRPLPMPQDVHERRFQLQQRRNVTLLLRTTVFGIFGHNHVGMLEHVADRRCRASDCGRCARARSSPRPARTSVRSSLRATIGPASCSPTARGSTRSSYGVAPGRQVVVATCGDSAYGAARDMLKAGVKVTTLIDVRPDPHVALVRDAAGRSASRC